jgi:hypothetical protein
LEKFPPEDLQKGDEVFGNNWDTKWGKSDYAERGRVMQCEKLWYRRRIETNNPTSSDSCKETPTPNSSHLGQIIEVRNYEDADWQRAELEAVFPKTEFAFVARVEKNTRDFPTNWRYGRLVQADCNNSTSPDSCKVCAYEATDGELIQLPNGQTIRITAKGFEVG